MASSHLISVLMPVYNSEKYLDEAINSILQQTYSNFELIISYDESQDDTLKIINKYKSKDLRIIVSYGKRRGIIGALNDAMSISKGTYIARMDADDISLPQRFEKQVKFMQEHLEIGVCGSWIEVFRDFEKSYILKYPATNDLLKLKLLFSVPFAHPSVLLRREIMLKHGLKYNESYDTIEDYKLWLDLSKYTRFGNIQEVLLKYRHLDTSLSKLANLDSNKRYLANKKVFTELLSMLNIKNTEEENKLHFTLGMNTRIAEEHINLEFLNNYLKKLIKANNKKNLFDEQALKIYMAKKFIVVTYSKAIRKDLSFLSAIFYRFFWQAPLIFIRNKNL